LVLVVQAVLADQAVLGQNLEDEAVVGKLSKAKETVAVEEVCSCSHHWNQTVLTAVFHQAVVLEVSEKHYEELQNQKNACCHLLAAYNGLQSLTVPLLQTNETQVVENLASYRTFDSKHADLKQSLHSGFAAAATSVAAASAVVHCTATFQQVSSYRN
jgi:hypothetical protein